METIFGFIHEPTPTGGLTQVEEVILTLPDQLSAATAISIQTGVYGGGGPAAVEGTTTLTLPLLFNTDPKIQVFTNGLELHKPNDVQRASSTQLTFSDKLKANAIITVRIDS